MINYGYMRGNYLHRAPPRFVNRKLRTMNRRLGSEPPPWYEREAAAVMLQNRNELGQAVACATNPVEQR